MTEEGVIFCVILGVMSFSPLRALTILSKGNYKLPISELQYFRGKE